MRERRVLQVKRIGERALCVDARSRSLDAREISLRLAVRVRGAHCLRSV
jgi:hypothetical protein